MFFLCFVFNSCFSHVNLKNFLSGRKMKLIQIKTKVPSYLQSFNVRSEEIHLIFTKKPSIHYDSTSDNSTGRISETSTEDTILDECELTGTPLQVDLGEADDTVLDVKPEETRNLWAPDETKHFPLKPMDARKLLTEYCTNNPVSKMKETRLAFVICDGQDKEKTVILGAGTTKTPMSLKILNLGCLMHEDAFEMLGDITKTHLKQARSRSIRNPEIKSLVKIKYDIYGRSLKQLSIQNEKMRNRDRHASVALDVTCKKCVITPSENDSNLKMNLNLEIVVGHELLSMNEFWKELCVLQSFLDLLFDSKSSSNENTVLCPDPWESKKIFQKISILVSTSTSRLLKPQAGIDIDLNNLRELDILDKSWDILKNCENLYILRESIHHLFEEISDSDSNMPVSDNDSNIAVVVNGIINKNMLLTLINFAQALDFLFELGARKLKKDYRAMLAHFCPSAKSKIDSVFSSFFTKYSPNQENVRRTTVSQNLKVNRLDTRVEQLGYLTQLHVASELIFLVKEQVNLLEDSFNHFCKLVCKDYVEDATKITDFSEVYQSPLKNFSFELFSKEVRIVQNLYPVRWTLEMKSGTTANSQVTTVFDLSQTPIFPPAIVNYEVPSFDENSDSKMVYYAAYMHKREGFF